MKLTKNQWIAYIGGFLLLLLAWFLRSVLLYFVIAMLVSFIGSPLMRFFDRIKIRNFKLPRALSAIMVLLVIGGVVFTFLAIVFPPLISQISAVSSVSESDFNRSFGLPLAHLKSWLSSLGVPDENLTLEFFKKTIRDKFNMDTLGKIVESLVSGTTSAIGWIFITLFISFFLLKEKFLLYRVLHVLTPSKYESQMQAVMRNLNLMLGKYLRSLLLQILVFGTYIYIGLSVAGEKYALTVALFSGLVNLISYIGPLLGVTFALIFSIFGNIGADFYSVIVPDMYQVIIVYGIAVMLDNFISYPLIFSNSLNVHPLELFFVILAGAQLGGLPGMMLAAPIYTIIRIIAKEFLSRFELVKNVTKRL